MYKKAFIGLLSKLFNSIFNALPALNAGTLLAGISISLPV